MDQQWINKFNNGDFYTGEAERTGRPLLDIDDNITECLGMNKYATTATMAEEIGVGKETVRRHLLKMNKRYLCNRWLPHRLSDENRANREGVCGQLLHMFNENNFLNRIITVDECWVYWRNDRSYHNRSWFGPDDQPTTSVRQTSMTKQKFLACVFWDAKGLLLMEILPQGQPLNSEIYCTLLDKLSDALLSKRRRSCSDRFFLQDNARPHTAQASMNKLRQLGFQILPHPPYSPDISPSDFYLFHPMKDSIRTKEYTCQEEIVNDLNQWFAAKPNSFFSKAFQILPERWQSCINASGAYFDHLRETD